MRRFRFNIGGLTTDDLRRWRRLSRSSATVKMPAVLAKAALLVTVCVGVLYAVERPGRIRIDRPASGWTTGEETAVVRGSVRNASLRSVALHINGVPRSVLVRDGSFRAAVGLRRGPNAIVASVPGTVVSRPVESNTVVVMREELDRFGNPIGDWYGLAADGEFDGSVLLVWSSYRFATTRIFPEDNPLWSALRGKGFDIRTRSGPFKSAWLKEADQLWIIAGENAGLGDAAGDVVASIHEGLGVYILADNYPYFVDANTLIDLLFGTRIQGNCPGRQTIDVHEPGPARAGRAWADANHPLLTDIDFLYEGWTVSYFDPTDQLEPVLVSSCDGEVLAAIARNRELRVVVDCAFTRYTVELVMETPGTIRFAENIAAYLMGRDHKSRR